MQLAAKDLRRLWILLGALEVHKPTTLTHLQHSLGWQVSTIQRLIERLNSEQLPGITIANAEGKLHVANWGILVNKDESLSLYNEFIAGNTNT